ncbi:MAG: type II secretion system protein N [Candidatus Competibacteraceae bacterium]
MMLALAKRLRAIRSKPQSLSQTAADGVTILLVILLAHTLARFAWSILAPGLPATLQRGGGANVRETTAMPASPQASEYVAITDWHLFGQADAAQAVESPAPVAGSVAPLNLRLTGIFFIEQGKSRALALIADGSGPEHGYRIGEMLPGGVRLEQIQRDHVVISHSGRQEALQLPKFTGNAEGAVGADMPPGMPSDMPPGIPPEMDPGPATFRESHIIDTNAMIGRFRDKATAMVRPQAQEEMRLSALMRTTVGLLDSDYVQSMIGNFCRNWG